MTRANFQEDGKMAAPFAYDKMRERPDALERLDLRIGWGPYEIHVLRFHLTQFPPGRIVPFHKHAEFEFHYIPRGKGKVILGEQEFPLKQGQLYLTGPEVMHYQEADAYEYMDELCLHVVIKEKKETASHLLPASEDQWEWEEARQCVNKLENLPLYPAQDLHGAMPCFLAAYEAITSPYGGSYTTIKQSVIQILLRTARAYDAATEINDLPTKDMKTYRYRLALEFMQSNYGGALSLDDVAEKLRLSGRQLQRLFKELHGGHSFSRILEDIRLAAVCSRLADEEMSVEQIARETGFSSGSYLHAVFRKRYGMTPSQYRSIHYF
jgi:AraC-like DNA-binding protein/quercetin dioxygenase-like cupin family protein